MSHNPRGHLHACHFYLYSKGAFVEERLWQLGIQALLLLGVALCNLMHSSPDYRHSFNSFHSFGDFCVPAFYNHISSPA